MEHYLASLLLYRCFSDHLIFEYGITQGFDCCDRLLYKIDIAINAVATDLGRLYKVPD